MRAKRLATLLICLALPAVAGAGFTDAGIDGEIKALTIYEGNLIAGGEFTTAGGVTANGIARWSGGAWQPLGRGLEGVQMYWDTRGDTIYFQPYVAALTVFRGDLIAGGSFTQAGGVPAVSIPAKPAVPVANDFRIPFVEVTGHTRRKSLQLIFQPPFRLDRT